MSLSSAWEGCHGRHVARALWQIGGFCNADNSTSDFSDFAEDTISKLLGAFDNAHFSTPSETKFRTGLHYFIHKNIHAAVTGVLNESDLPLPDKHDCILTLLS